jgi:phage-related protein
MKIYTHPKAAKFIQSVDEVVQIKVLRVIGLLERYGYQLPMPHSKKLTRHLFELRIFSQVKIRLLYCFYKKSPYILHGFIKKTQKTPSKELEIAKTRQKDLTRL